MNLKNLETLAQWLEAGAPHQNFTMEYALNLTEDIEDEPEFFLDQRGQTLDTDCGTVCCIAGAAFLMSKAPEGQMLPDPETQVTLVRRYPHWNTLEKEALEWLGLEAQYPDASFQHDLFDPNMAPPRCTPRQAAEAVRRVMKGEEPW